jgi:acyl carrier protein
MIPSRFVILNTLPINPNGKIDRNALQRPENIRPVLDNPFVPPKTPIEQTLVEIWSEVLDIQPVGIHDKFLELGCNSILATRIISRVLSAFQVKLTLKSLLAAPTIAEMATLITINQAERVDHEELDSMLADLEKLSNSNA